MSPKPSPPFGKFLAFDLGDTLVEYEGLPLSWSEHYPAALYRLATFLEVRPTAAQVEAACSVLSRFNTRLNPRETEVAFEQILKEISRLFSVSREVDPDGAARAFFAVFRQRLRSFDDAVPTLAALKSSGAKVAIFTDVPYGMPRSLVLEDIGNGGLRELPDLIVTSGEVGFRKPSPAALGFVAQRLGCAPGEMTHVGNEQKDVAAARATGCRAVLLARRGPAPSWGQDRTITSLAELLES